MGSPGSRRARAGKGVWPSGGQPAPDPAYRPSAVSLGRFSEWFDQELLKGERIELTYLPGKGTEVVVRGAVRGVIDGADFMRALWSVWLGPKPVDGGLKKGMLGSK